MSGGGALEPGPRGTGVLHRGRSRSNLGISYSLRTEKQGQLQRTEVRMAAARVFKVEFRIAVAQTDLKWRECVFAEQSVQDQAQRSFSLLLVRME